MPAVRSGAQASEIEGCERQARNVQETRRHLRLCAGLQGNPRWSERFSVLQKPKARGFRGILGPSDRERGVCSDRSLSRRTLLFFLLILETPLSGLHEGVSKSERGSAGAKVSYRVSFRLSSCWTDEACVTPARVLAQRDSR